MFNILEKEKEVKVKKQITIEVEDPQQLERIEKVINFAQHIPPELMKLTEIKGTRRKAKMSEDTMKSPNKEKIIVQSEFTKLNAVLDQIVLERATKQLDEIKEKLLSQRKSSNMDNNQDIIEEKRRSRSKGVRLSKKTSIDITKKGSATKTDDLSLMIRKEMFSVDNFIKDTYSDINLESINRPFSIFISGIRLNKKLNSSFENKEDNLELILKVKIIFTVDETAVRNGRVM